MAERNGRRERLKAERLLRAKRLPSRLIRGLRAARALLVLEALGPLVWQIAGILLLYVGAALLGLPQRLGPGFNSLLLAADVLAAFGVLAFGLARLRWPDMPAAERRLSRASGFRHDPITTLLDTPAQMDAQSYALWRAHRARVLAETRRMRLGLPWPWRLPAPALAYRAGLVVALGLCLWVAGPMAAARLQAAFVFEPWLLLGPGGAPPAVTAWVTPPAYTGRPPLLLPAHQAELTVPRGARLTVTVSGLRHAPRMMGLDRPFHALDAESFQLETGLEASGLYTLRGGGTALARWQIMVQPDAPPIIGFTGRPGPDPDGFSLRLPWRARDDYGVISARMTAHLIGNPAAPALSLPLDLPTGPSPKIDAVQVTDLSANPWAGLPVAMQLEARDAAGQRGLSATETVVLPERRFVDAYARRVIAIRKSLVQAPDSGAPKARLPAVEAILETAAAATMDGKSARDTLPLFATGWALAQQRGQTVVAEAVDTLWQVALHFEQGNAADTGQSLLQAEAALQKALQRGGASSAELQRLLQQMQAAVLQHLSTLMQMAQRQGGEVAAGSTGRPFDLGQLARQMQAMQAAARAGDVAGMQQALAQLQQSLRQLSEARIVKPDPKQMAARAAAEQALGRIQQMMQKQAALIDRSSSRAETGSPDAAGQQQDAAAQAALERAAQALAAQGGAAMSSAAGAMANAVRQLGSGQDGAAARAQGQALQALQQAANSLGRQLAAGQGQGGGFTFGSGTAPGSPGTMPEDGFANGQGLTDPLGRPLSDGQGNSFGADVALPNGGQQARLRAILQELRAKAGDRSLSPAALDYIERLLQPF